MPGPNHDGTPSIGTPLYNANATGGKRPLPSATTDPTNRGPGAHPHPSAQAPATNTSGNPLITTSPSDQNTNSKRPQSSSTATTTSTRSDAQGAHRSGQIPAGNTGGNPSSTTQPSDPNTKSRRPHGSSTTMTWDAEAVHRSGQMPAANEGGTPSTALPQHDANSSSKGYNSSSTGTSNHGVQPHHSAQDAHHGISEDQEKGSSGAKKSSRHTDQGGPRIRGDEGEHKANVLKKIPPARSTRAGERKGSQSGSSTESTGTHSYSPTDPSQERRMASKVSTALANVQPQSRPASQQNLYSRALVGGKIQSANHHPETGSNAADTRASDPMNARQQLGSKPAQSLPPGAAEADPPTARHRETQPGEDTSTEDPSIQPSSHVVDVSTDDSTHGDDEEPDGSHPQLPGSLSIEESQHVQGEGGEGNIAQPSGYLAGFRNIAGAILGPTGQAQPPRDKTKEELQRTKTKLRQVEYDFRRAQGDNANLHRHCLELDSENRRNKDTIRSLQHEITNMGRELQEYKNLSEIRGRELLGAQVFLTKADHLSISDVKDKVNTLNDENFQASASLGDALVHSKYESAKEEWDAAFAEACRTVSEPLTRALVEETQKPELEVNPLLVQVVLEMYLVSFCTSKIESWFPGTRDTSDFLASIYTEIRQSEEQAVSGRWRALTRAHIRPTSATWRDEFMLGLGNIFKIAEWNIGSQENLKAFEQKLPAIFKAVEDLRLALGEKVTSIDLEVNVVSPGGIFDHRWMVDGYGDARQGNMKKSAEVVAGTTGIGLKKFVQSPSGDLRFDDVLAPKVVLVSTLQEALAPLPTTRSSKKGGGRVGGGQEGQQRSPPSKGV